MLTRFYSYTLITNFIKHLISVTPLPTIQSWKPGKFVVKGLTYVTSNSVVKAIKTGNPTLITDDYFQYLYPYEFGKYYKGMTSTYSSNIKGYDSKTHYCLGQYLRAVRDLKDINLMPFYNCVNDEHVRGLSIDNDGSIRYNEDDACVLLAVPVKFDQTYTICLESTAPIHYGYIIYNETGYDGVATKALNSLINDTLYTDDTSQVAKKIQFNKKTNCTIKNPFTINTLKAGEINENISTIGWTIDTFSQYEKYLKLVIKIPNRTINTSVVVLEGNYTSSFDYKFNLDVGTKLLSVERITADNDGKLIITPNYYPNLLSELTLTQLNDGITYAFSDTLVEYLLLNVITPLDTIGEDIERIQYYASHLESNPYIPDSLPGVWSDSLRKYLFNLSMGSNNTPRKLDITGYVDKKVEKVLTNSYSPTWDIKDTKRK